MYLFISNAESLNFGNNVRKQVPKSNLFSIKFYHFTHLTAMRIKNLIKARKKIL